MGSSSRAPCSVLLCILIGLCAFYQCSGIAVDADQTAQLFVNASKASSRKIPENLFGIFFEEINHAGAGGLWAELVQNRGFEAGGQNTPSNIYPWSILGDESSVLVSTDRSSCFDRNKIALRLEVLCDSQAPKICPSGGVGISNPGFWGMNIEQGKSYKLVLYVSSSNSINLSASLSDSTGLQTLATANIVASDLSNWTKVEVLLEAKATDPNSKLQLTTTQKGVIWFDQVSLMPLDTYKGHGFRNDLFRMLADIKPGFIRFPGGCFVEGEWLRNAFRWKETIGPWEERPGHFGDVWNYWTDDGLGHFEFFQLAEDLGAVPIWVFNNGISHTDQVDTANILPFIREILDGLEFAKGDANSTWGSVRAAMGHPEPFDLRYVAIGNEDCGKKNYRGNYLKFYDAIKRSYPDIKIISNCDGSSQKLDHPADMYDYHIYSDAKSVFSRAHAFDHSSRSGPKAFVSEYAVTGDNAGKGSLLAALAEAGFLIGLERNSDIVEMASYAPLFVNVNDRRWNPDAIVFNSAQLYGTPSYWMQYFFKESNGATLLNSTLQTNSSASLIASAIIWQNTEDNKNYLRLKLVNFGDSTVNLKISIDGLELNSKPTFGSTKTVLTSTNLMDENSFSEPKKVAPVRNNLEFTTKDVDVKLSPHSFTSVDLLTVKTTSSDSKDILDEQLRHVQSDINMLEDHKTQLEIYLGERAQEADTLTSRIQELEIQLCKEKDECKRIVSKTKKFIKAYNRHSRIQEELLRSQAQLQKLGDQLGSDAAKPGTNEENASVSILSGDTVPNHVMSSWTELHNIASPSKKRQRIQVAEGDDQLKQATPAKGEGLMPETFRSEKLLCRDVHHAQLNNNKEANVKVNRNNGWRPMSNEGKINRGKKPTTDIPLDDKLKVSGLGFPLPSTSVVAHSVDEVVEVVEMDEKFEVVGNSSARAEKGVANEVRRLPFPLPPPPPVSQHAYSQYQGDGTENVDVDGMEEETVYVDII